MSVYNEDVSSFHAFCMLLISIVSLFLYSVLTGTLQDQPLSKQCLVNRLYQDAARINLISVCFWALSGVVWSVLGTGNIISKLQTAETISLIHETIVLTTLQNLNTIGILRLLIAKDKVLDPLSNWFEDENSAIRTIRIITMSVSGIFAGTIYIFSLNSPVYYNILQENISNVPTGSMVVLILEIALLMLSGILHATATFFHLYGESRLAARYLYDNTTVTFVGCIELSTCFRNRSNSARSDVQTIIGPVICYIVTSLVAIVGFIFIIMYPYYVPFESTFWIMMTLFIGIQGAGIPILLICRYEAPKIYLKRRYQPFKLTVVDWIANFQVTLRRIRRGTQVQDESDNPQP